MVVRSRRELYAVAGAALAAYLVWRPAMLRWGTQAGESAEPLPGDGLAPRPRVQSTRAITIDVPPGRVWPWIVQMGIGRAGFYTHDRVERLMSTPAEGGVRMSIVTGARGRPPPWSPWRPRADGTSIPAVVRSRLAVAAGIKTFQTLAWLRDQRVLRLCHRQRACLGRFRRVHAQAVGARPGPAAGGRDPGLPGVQDQA